MASHVPIPRFLLPQTGSVWPRANLGNRAAQHHHQHGRRVAAGARLASSSAAKGDSSRAGSKAKPKSMVLEKPERFNPPSHGARLPKKGARPAPQSQHYGGALLGEELAAQRTREYPGMPPPRGTWSHWFWNSRALHLTITMVGRDSYS